MADLYRCRKCREHVFDSDCVVTVNPLSDDPLSCTSVEETVSYISEELAPAWIHTAIQGASWTKGKLLCPKCRGRLGAFDFTRRCGVFTAIHILLSRVDVITPQLSSLNKKLCEAKTVKHDLDRTTERSGLDTDLDIRNRTLGSQLLARKRTIPKADVLNQCEGDLMNQQQGTLNTATNHEGQHDDGQCNEGQCDEGQHHDGQGDEGQRDEGQHHDSQRDEGQCGEGQHHEGQRDEGQRGEGQCGEGQHHEGQRDEGQSDEGQRDEGQRDEGQRDEPPFSSRIEHIEVLNPLKRDHRKHRKQIKKNVLLTENSFQEVAEPAFPEEHTCSVCLDLYCYPTRISPCDHIFCDTCLRRLARDKPVNTLCPLCRQVIIKCRSDNDFARDLKALYNVFYKNRERTEHQFRNDFFYKLPEKCVPRYAGRDRRTEYIDNIVLYPVRWLVLVAFMFWFVMCRVLRHYNRTAILSGVLLIGCLTLTAIFITGHVVSVIGTVAQSVCDTFILFLDNLVLSSSVELLTPKSGLQASVRVRALTANFCVIVILVLLCRYVFFRRVMIELRQNR